METYQVTLDTAQAKAYAGGMTDATEVRMSKTLDGPGTVRLFNSGDGEGFVVQVSDPYEPGCPISYACWYEELRPAFDDFDGWS